MISYNSNHRLKIKQSLIEQSQNCCMICKRQKRLVLDHDHATKMIRGVLCHKCNVVLGYFADDVELFKAAIAYLTDPPGHKVPTPERAKINNRDLSWLPRMVNRIPTWVPRRIDRPKDFFKRPEKGRLKGA